MTCDRRSTLAGAIHSLTFPAHGRTRLFSTPEKQDLETIYEVITRCVISLARSLARAKHNRRCESSTVRGSLLFLFCARPRLSEHVHLVVFIGQGEKLQLRNKACDLSDQHQRHSR